MNSEQLKARFCFLKRGAVCQIHWKRGVHAGETGAAHTGRLEMNWKTAFRSFYYQTLDEPPPVVLAREQTALLVVDIQACYLPATPPDDEAELPEWERWRPFRERMHEVVVPQTQKLLAAFRAGKMDVFFARIACLNPEGRDRSLSQARPGFNNILLPHDGADSQIYGAVTPLEHEIVVLKTTDSALTGTNLRLLLHNMGIKNVVVCGIFTDQCVSSTVRSLADESFNVVVVHDAGATATMELHNSELCIINNIYCQVMSTDEVLEVLS